MKPFITKITWLDGTPTLQLTPEMMEAWGATAGDAFEVSLKGRQIIARLLTEQELDATIEAITDDLFARRRSAYEKLAEGVRYYYENANVTACAATYAYHLSQVHAFVDGNKRIAALATEIFLLLNGLQLQATNNEIAALFLGIAASDISRAQIEQQITNWASPQ